MYVDIVSGYIEMKHTRQHSGCPYACLELAYGGLLGISHCSFKLTSRRLFARDPSYLTRSNFSCEESGGLCILPSETIQPFQSPDTLGTAVYPQNMVRQLNQNRFFPLNYL